MAGTFGIDGLISGLNTTSLISGLMQIEAAPQTLLKAKQSDTTKLVTALQALNAKVASLAAAARKAATPVSWQALKASSSSDSVAVAVASGASATQVTLTVDRLAASQVSLTPAFATPGEYVGAGNALTFVRSAGGPGEPATTVEIDTTGIETVPDLVDAINRSDAGVSAVAIKLSDGTYRLQLTSKESGEAGAFWLHRGTADEVGAGTAQPGGLSTVRAAQDAKVTLWPASGAEQEFTSSTNTFAGILTGVSFTVSKVETEPVTVTLSSDGGALRTLASSLVSQLNLVLGEIASQTKSSEKKDEETGRTLITGGVLSGQGSVRTLQTSISQAASYGVTYQGAQVSPSSVGIVVGKDGTFTFDQATFDAALAADPGKVQAVITALAERVATVTETASDPYEGTLTQLVTSQQDVVKDLGDRIEDWDRRLELRQEMLQAQYAALEVALSKLQSQSTWLASQLNALTANSSSYSGS